HNGYDASLPALDAASLAEAWPEYADDLAKRTPIPPAFTQVLGMGGGGGDMRVVWDGLKANGAKNLVVIGYGGTSATVKEYLDDLFDSAYAPFERIDAFFLSTQEQAESQAIKTALARPDTAVYFTGGNQTDYLDLFWGTDRTKSFLTTINKLFGQGLLS